MSDSSDLKLRVIIDAIVNGVKDVLGLGEAIKDVGDTAGKPLPDPTGPLTQGAGKAKTVLDTTTKSIGELGSQASHSIPDPTGPLTQGAGKTRTAVDGATKSLEGLTNEAAAAAAIDMARGILDVRPHQAIEAEIKKVRDAFETLKKSNQLSQAEIAQAAVKTEQRIAELKAATNGWKDSLLSAKGALLEAAGAGVGMKTLIAQAIEFEFGMANVEKTTGLSRQQLEGLGETLKHLSTQLPINADGLTKIAEAGGQLGIAGDQIEAFTRLAAKMATAFDMSADESGTAIAKMKTNFQLGLEGVEALGDAVNVLGNNTAAKEKDIIEVLTRIGGSAKQFGMTAEQAAALSATLLGMGMPAEQAGTAINALLSKLQTARVGSKDFQEGLAQLGISADQMAAMVAANPQKALTDFLHLLEKTDAQSRAEILTRMFGEEHQDEIARLVNGLKDYDQALTLVADKNMVAGSMSREFEDRLKTAKAQLDLMKNSLEVAAINLGEVFLPDVKVAAGALAAASQAIAEFAHANPEIIKVAETFGVVLAASGALKAGYLALRLAGMSSAADMAAAWRAASVATAAEMAVTEGRMVSLAAKAKALSAIDIGAGLKAGAMVAFGLEVADLTTKLIALEEQRQKEARAEKDAMDARVAAHARAKRIMEENQQYASVAIQNFEALKSKSAEESAAYIASLERAAKYWDAVAAQADRKSHLHADAEKEANRYRAAIATLTKEQQQNAEATGEQIARTDGFAAALDKAAKATEGGAKKFSELVTQYDLLKPDNADKLELAIRKLSSASEGAAREVKEQLLKAYSALTGPELQAEIDALRAKTQQIGPVSREVAAALDAGVREQFRRIGVDADQALTGVSKKVSEGIAALRGLAESGQLTGRALKEGLSNLIDQAKTTGELRAINEEINRLGKEGKLSFTELVTAHQQVAEAQKKIGVSAEEVRAAQDKARVSADVFAQALKAAGGNLTNLNQVLAQHPELQAIAKQAALDSAEAFRLQGLQAESTGKSISEMASDITAGERARAAAFNQQQTAADALAKSQKQQADAQAKASQGFKEGEQALSPYLALYLALGQYGEQYVQTMQRIGEQLTYTNDWVSDLDWGGKKLAELQEQGKRAEEAVARLGAQDMQELRHAIYDAGNALQGLHGEKWDAMRKRVEDAEKRMSDVLAKQMQDRQKALEEFAKAREKADRKAEEAEVKTREDYVQAGQDAAKKLAEAQRKVFEDEAKKAADLARNYADELAKIQNERYLFEASIEDKIREIRRDGMDEDQQRSDRQLELREKLAALQKSLAEGDVAEAERLRDQAVALAESLAKATYSVGQDQAQKEAIDALNQIKDLNAHIDEEKKTQAQKKHDAEMALLEMEKRKSLADAKAVYDDAMAKAEEIRRKKVDDLNAAYQEELKLARQAHQEKMAQIDAENQARGASTATGDGKKTTITKRAKGGPVKKDEDYLVTEEGPETYVTDDGEAYRLESDGPTPFRAPKDGTILPAGTSAPLRRLATASAGPADMASADTAARRALAATPEPAAPAPASSSAPASNSQFVRLVRYQIEDRANGNTTLHGLESESAMMDKLLRSLAQSKVVAG